MQAISTRIPRWGRAGIPAVIAPAAVFSLLVVGCAAPAFRAPVYPDLNSKVKPVVVVAGAVTALDESDPHTLRVAVQVDTAIVGRAADSLQFGTWVRLFRSVEGCARVVSGNAEEPNLYFQVGDTVVVFLAPPRAGREFYELLDAYWVAHPLQQVDQPVLRQTKADPTPAFKHCEGKSLSTAALYARVVRTWQGYGMSLGEFEADIRDFYANRRRWGTPSRVRY